MKKLKSFGWWLLLGVALALSGVSAWILEKKRTSKEAREQMAADLKAKVEAIRAARAVKKAEAEKQVEQIRAAEQVEVSRDSVDAANDLISSLRGDGKGG
jgi:cytoskeletal protein RodZ